MITRLCHGINHRGARTRRADGRLLLVVVGVALFLSGCSSNKLSSSPSSGSNANFSNASLNGGYAYTLGGSVFDGSTATPYQRAGVFVADGNGNITQGTDDFLEQGNTLTSGPVSGSYTISNDGTGIVNLTTSGGQLALAVTISSGGKVNLIDFDTNRSGAGQAVTQDATTMAPAGTFVFRIHSFIPGALSTASISAVGSMTWSSGSVTGSEDIVRFETFSSVTLTGTFTSPDSNGRGTLSITDSAGFPSNYVYYAVNPQTLTLLETDISPLGLGRAEAQSSIAFSNASLKGGFAFRSRGDTLNHINGVNSSGAFTSDGAGNLTNGSYDSVQDGTPVQNASLTGNYSITANGRVVLNLSPTVSTGPLSPIQDIAWMVDSSHALFLVNASDRAEDGNMDAQSGGAFSASSVNGSFSFVMFGYDSQSPIEVDRVGLMTFDGNGNLTLTNYYLNRSGSRNQLGTTAGTYSVAGDGRVFGSVNGVTKALIVYLISSSSGDLLLGDSGSEISGSISQQTTP